MTHRWAVALWLCGAMGACVAPRARLRAQATSRKEPTTGVRADTQRTAMATRGVYTSTQATRGQQLYRARCNSCHAATAYTGATFTQLWVGRSAYDLVTLLRRTMPNDDPGALAKQEYVDIVAYLFRLNGYPAGPRALPVNDPELRLVRIDARPSARR